MILEKSFPGRSGLLALILPLALLAGAGLAAQTPEAVERTPRRIGLEEAVDLAIRNNLELDSQRISTEAARRARSLSWNTFVPDVTLGAGLSRSNYENSTTTIVPTASLPGFGLATITRPQWSLSGSLQVSLRLGIASFESLRAARIAYETGLITLEQAKARIERDVRKAYFDMLFIQEQIALLQESFITAQRQAEMARTNFRSGLIPETQYLQAQVAVENMKPQMEQAESGLRLQMAAFANTLGLPVDTGFALAPLETGADFIPLDVAALISGAAAGNPDVESLRRRILGLESTRRSTFFQLYTPSLTLSWNAQPAFAGDPWKDNWFDGGNWPKPLGGAFTISLGFLLNGVLPFTSQNQNLRTIDDQLRQLNIGLAQAVRGTELSIYSTVSSLEQARISAEAQRSAVTLAERSYRMTEQAYRSGASELLELRSAEQQLHQARLNVLQQQFNYLKGLIDLEYAIGVPFGTLSTREIER